MRNEYTVSVGNTDGNRSLGITKSRYEDAAMLDVKEAELEIVGTIHPA
jgi:hypothetical protein